MFIHLINTEQVEEVQKPVTLILEQFLAHFTLELDRDDNGAIKQSMAQKIAGSGLSYSHLKELYLKFGTKGLLAILGMPPSQSTATKPRVTRTKRILDAIANHFQETFPKEE